jgi:hypothetical protein
MSFMRTRRAMVLLGATVLLMSPAMAAAEQLVAWPHHAAACNSCPTGVSPYAANRIMWTPSYGVTSVCNPACPGTCTAATTAYMPVSGPYATTAYMPVSYNAYMPVSYTACMPACGTCAPCATTVAYTTYRPFWDWFFHPFAPRVTYSMAAITPACATGCCPTAGCATGCCPTGGCESGCCPTGGCPTTTYLPATCCPSACPTGCPTGCPSGCPAACGTGCAAGSCSSGSCVPATVQAPDAATQQPTLNATPGPYTAPGTTNPVPTYESGAGQPGASTGVYRIPAQSYRTLPATTVEPQTRPVKQAAYLLPATVPSRPKSPADAPLDLSGWKSVAK